MNRVRFAVLAAALTLLWHADATAATDRQTRTFPLPAGRQISVEITVGTIVIEGWSREDAEIQVVRHAPDAAGFARLPLAIDETPASVHVTNVQIDGTDPAFRTEMRLRIPAEAVLSRVRIMEGRLSLQGFAGTITADVQRGNIEGRRVSGTVRLETGIGDVSLSAARLSAGGLLRLRTFNGDVRLVLSEAPADARIMALALNGGVTSDIPLNMKDTWGPRFGEATLGRGEPIVSLDVVTGNIEIRVAP